MSPSYPACHTGRIIGLLLLGASLSSCGESAQDVSLLRGMVNPASQGFDPRALELAATRPIPPRLEVEFTKTGLAGVLLRETVRDGVESWISADGGAITLTDGMLTSAPGFGSGMAASDVKQSAALIHAGQAGPAERFHSFLNGNDEIVLRAYRCDIAPVGREDVFVQGIATVTLKIEENCYGLDQQFTNTYWTDPSSGQIVQSRQWSGDFLGQIFMKTVPEGSPA